MRSSVVGEMLNDPCIGKSITLIWLDRTSLRLSDQPFVIS